MGTLNQSPIFQWAVMRKEGMAKVCIGHESFWVRDCQQQEDGTYHGTVDNELFHTDIHGLDYNDKISFSPTM